MPPAPPPLGLGEYRGEPTAFSVAPGEVVRAAIEELPGPAARCFRTLFEDHDANEPLEVGGQYTIAFDVGLAAGDVLGWAPFPEDAFTADDSLAILTLTVQLDSADVEILGASSRPLRVPRSGPSQGKARFDFTPLREGPARLTATIHSAGNFVSQLEVAVVVGAATSEVEVRSVGRPPDSAAVLEPRDISLIIAPAPGGGFTCTAVGSVGAQAVLPITVDELALAVEAARQALLAVVKSVHEGEPVFQTGLDIPPAAGAAALRTLARAGARLFQRIFLHPAAGPDARAVGTWLREYATDPALRLTVQVFAAKAPLPWAMLYLGDASEGTELSWDLFLGLRHVVEQIPLHELSGTKDNTIRSTPTLAVSANVNRTIDAAMGITLVAAHEQRWARSAAERPAMRLVPRSTRAQVVRALADADSADQIIYFYCHATADGPNGDPDGAAIILAERSDAVTLADLNLDAPTSIQLVGRPLVFINACESADLSPRFYNGFVPYFMDKGARGVIGTECNTPALFAIEWADAFFDRFLDGAALGETVLALRQEFLRAHGNPLGLLYAVHCDADTRIAPALAHAAS